MKHLKKFNEALKPSQFRKYVKHIDKERYADIFQEYKEKYDGDRNAYRIYLPLLQEENPVEKEIADFLDTINVEIIDYRKGQCRFKDAKNPSKIGQVLTRNKQDKLFKMFVEDPFRKAGEDLMVCISRHPYDIAGADTDRAWTNCMTLASDGTPRIDRLEDELRRAVEKDDKEWIDDVKKRIKNQKGVGKKVRFLLEDVKKGSLISFLIKKNDRNIENPIANLNIKPFVNVDDKDDVILVCDRKMYGRGTPEFKKTILEWVREVNGELKGGYYKVKAGLYFEEEKEMYTFERWVEKNKRNIIRQNPYKVKDVYDVEYLNCSSVKFINLDGIEKFTNLKELDISDCRLKELNLKPFPKLEKLVCNDNYLKYLNLDDVPNLEELYCAGNELPYDNLKGYLYYKKNQ